MRIRSLLVAFCAVAALAVGGCTLSQDDVPPSAKERTIVQMLTDEGYTQSRQYPTGSASESRLVQEWTRPEVMAVVVIYNDGKGFYFSHLRVRATLGHNNIECRQTAGWMGDFLPSVASAVNNCEALRYGFEQGTTNMDAANRVSTGGAYYLLIIS